VTNPGCTPLTMSLFLLDSTKTKPPPSDMFYGYVPPGSHPISSGDSLFGYIRVTPLRMGFYQGYLKVTYSIEGRPSVDTFVPFRIFIKPGSKTLALDNSLRNFDTITFCSHRDITIPIVNTGCDTMRFNLLTLV